MKSELYRVFMRSMKQAVESVKAKRPLVTNPLRLALCAACGQYKPCTPINDVGFVCLDCSRRGN